MAASKFQLPTLTPINFSLTEGTNIPAPPESPPATPRPPTAGRGPLSSHPTTPNGVPPSANGTENPLSKTTTNTSPSSPTESKGPLSPTQTLSKRPGSVRRFLGLRSLSSDSLNSSSLAAEHGRPMSPATTVNTMASERQQQQPGLSRKKSGGSWFSRRKSAMFVGRVDEADYLQRVQEEEKQEKKNKGPPPPTLPALEKLAPEGALGDGDLGAEDLFKDIK